MIKARAKDTLFFGLSDENMRRLKKGQPIKIDLKEIGLSNGHIVIFYGPTEEIMETQLYAMVVPNEEHKN